MVGIFGGLLAVIQFVGGCLIYVLVGPKAWGTTEDAKGLRALFGGVIIGVLIGVAIQPFVTAGPAPGTHKAAWIGLTSIAGLFLGFALYKLDQLLRKPSDYTA